MKKANPGDVICYYNTENNIKYFHKVNSVLEKKYVVSYLTNFSENGIDVVHNRSNELYFNFDTLHIIVTNKLFKLVLS